MIKEQIFSFSSEKLLSELYKEIDKNTDKEEFNKFLKELITDNVITNICVKYAFFLIKQFETTVSEVQGIKGSILSDIISAQNIMDGTDIYKYKFTRENDSIFLNFERTDKKQDYYSYHITKYLKDINKMMSKEENIEVNISQFIISTIKLIYLYVEEYIEKCSKGELEYDNEYLTKEIFYILTDSYANEVYEDYLKNKKEK